MSEMHNGGYYATDTRNWWQRLLARLFPECGHYMQPEVYPKQPAIDWHALGMNWALQDARTQGPGEWVMEDLARAFAAGAKTAIGFRAANERVQKMRAEREALGLKRLELYAHPGDWPAIKALAEKLARKRARDEKRAG